MFVILLIINKIAIKSLQSKILKNSLGFKLKLGFICCRNFVKTRNIFIITF